jgi:hypothetical protein
VLRLKHRRTPGGSRKNILFLRVLKILTEDRHCVLPLFKAAPPAESILRF